MKIKILFVVFFSGFLLIKTFAQWSALVNVFPGSVSGILNESMGPCIEVSGDTIHVGWYDRFRIN